MAEASAEHQADLDPMGSPHALTEHQMPFQANFSEGETDKVNIVTIDGPSRTIAGSNIQYQVTKYNVDNPADQEKAKVIWRVFVNDELQNTIQPNKDILLLNIKNEWAGRELIIKAALNGSASDEVKTIVDYEYESIVVIGTQQHRGGRNFLKDPEPVGKMIFVHQALRKVYSNTEKRWTILFCIEGYSNNQKSTIRNAFMAIKNNSGKSVVLKYEDISNVDQIVSYINYGNKEGVEKNTRKTLKIDRMQIYTHGMVKKILPWMRNLSIGKEFNNEVAQKLKSEAFAPNALMYSFACRTGLGNKDIDDSLYDSQGKARFLLSAESLAQKISNATKTIVYAYLKRTWYGDSIFTQDERDFLAACKTHFRKGQLDEDNYYAYISNYGMTDAEWDRYYLLSEVEKHVQQIDDGLFLSTGARYPVKAANTPVGLPDDMKTYRPL